MRYTLLICLLALCFMACNKDKYTTAPQISFKSFNPAQGSNQNNSSNAPTLIIEATDAEGDLGLVQGKDTAKVFIKNMLTLKEDSLDFPDLQSAGKSNFKADVEVSLFSVLGGRNLPVSARPFADTLHFQVYIRDFAKNKSNVLITDQPFIFYTLP